MKQVEEQKMALGESGGNFLKKSDVVMAILVLFEQFLWQILFNFSPNSVSFTKYFLFKHFLFMRA